METPAAAGTGGPDPSNAWHHSLTLTSSSFFSMLADVSARTVWTSWWARGLSTSSKMSILGAATFASLHSAMETSDFEPTGAPKFKTSL